MKEITDRNLIRQYLLGKLDEQAELEEQLSECIFTNEKMTDIVDSVEDEIIEEYLEGSLAVADKHVVEKYFLQPSERKDRLRFMKLLTLHFNKEPFYLSPHIRERGNTPTVPWYLQFRTNAMAAALAVVMVACLIYVSGLRRMQAYLETELAQEKERSSAFAKQAELLQPAIVPLTLVADRSRAAETSFPKIEVKASTRRLLVEIASPSAGSGRFDVQLQSKEGNTPLWSARISPLLSDSGDARLVFDVPAEKIKSGIYSFAVMSTASGTQSVRHFDFQATVAN